MFACLQLFVSQGHKALQPTKGTLGLIFSLGGGGGGGEVPRPASPSKRKPRNPKPFEGFRV